MNECSLWIHKPNNLTHANYKIQVMYSTTSDTTNMQGSNIPTCLQSGPQCPELQGLWHDLPVHPTAQEHSPEMWSHRAFAPHEHRFTHPIPYNPCGHGCSHDLPLHPGPHSAVWEQFPLTWSHVWLYGHVHTWLQPTPNVPCWHSEQWQLMTLRELQMKQH